MTVKQPRPDGPKKYALLIGISFYFPNERNSQPGDLAGPVNDVRHLQSALEANGHWKIRTLTSTKGDDGRPVESDDHLPTHDNIVRELLAIETKAHPGDFLFFHYSGHGALRKDIRIIGDGDNITGSALVPADVGLGNPHFTAYDLGRIIKKMCTTEGLRAAVVLDSCHSGGGFRDENIRQLRLTPRTFGDGTFEMRDADFEASARITTIFNLPPPPPDEGRDAAALPTWLGHPTRCTVLMGCSINQSSYDGYPDETPRGLLSCYMTGLIRRPEAPSYLSARISIKQSIRNYAARNYDETLVQTPVLLGDTDYQLLGYKKLIPRPAISMGTETLQDGPNTRQISTLDIGSAQGVRVNAQYNIYSSHWNVLGVDTVTEVWPFKSDLAEHWPTGSYAVLRQWALPPTTVAVSANVQAGLAVPGLIISEDSSTNTPDYRLRVNGTTFKVHDKDNAEVLNVPTVDNADEAVFAVSHMARYQALKALNNQTDLPTGANDFKLSLTLRQGGHLRPVIQNKGRYWVNHEDNLDISLCVGEGNASSRLDAPTYVKYFSFTPRWGIVPLNGERSFTMDEVTGYQAGRCPITANNTGQGNLEETIRAFIYQGFSPPVWDEMTLPLLETALQRTAPEQRPEVEPVLPEIEVVSDGREEGLRPAARSLVLDTPPKWMVLELELTTLPATDNQGERH